MSFFVNPLRSVSGAGGAETAAALPGRSGVSVNVWLMINFGRLRGCDGSNLQFPQSGTDVLPGAFENFPHLPGKPVGFVDALNFRVAITGAEQSAQLPKSVKPLVVHFHYENVVKAGENAFQARRQR